MNDNKTAHSSADYDKQIKKTIPYYKNFHIETINLIKSINENPKTWLDTGCGTGNFIELAYNNFCNTNFYLADPSIEMIKLSKEKLIKKTRIISYIETDSEDYLGKEIFDIVTAIQVHHYLDKKGRENATKRCYELLKLGGIFITFENVRPNTEELTELMKHYWQNYQINQGKTVEEAVNHIRRFDKEYFPITIDEHKSLLKKVGFEIVELFWTSYMQAGFVAIKK